MKKVTEKLFENLKKNGIKTLDKKQSSQIAGGHHDTSQNSVRKIG